MKTLNDIFFILLVIIVGTVIITGSLLGLGILVYGAILAFGREDYITAVSLFVLFLFFIFLGGFGLTSLFMDDR